MPVVTRVLCCAQWVKNVSETMKGREEELSIRDSILSEQWRKEDDRQHLLREQRLREVKALEEEARMAALQEDLTLRMQRLEMERQAKVGIVPAAAVCCCSRRLIALLRRA
jgi:hypothetical protein